MSDDAFDAVLEGLWRFVSLHPEASTPEWTAAAQGGEDGWDERVSCWVIAVPEGLVLIDPLVEDWAALDRFLSDRGDCVGVVRTCHWHQRSVAEAASRYGVPVWAKIHQAARLPCVVDHEVRDQDELFGALRVIDVERADEIALWLGEQGALVFGDAMLRRGSGELRVCLTHGCNPPADPHGCGRC